MQCYELSDYGVIPGLQVEDPCEGADFLHIETTTEGSVLTLDPKMSPLITRARIARPGVPIRVHNLTVISAPEDEYLTPCPPHKEAMVLLRVSAAQGGVVRLEASNDRAEKCDGDEIVSDFGPFPPLGISLALGEQHDDLPKDKKPWLVGASKLELVLVMMKGASFRIYRSVVQPGVQRATYVKWTGNHLDVTRHMPNRSEYEARV